MAGTVTSTLNLATQTDKYSYSKAYSYTDGFVVRQEVGSADAFIKLIIFGESKAAQTLLGFKTLVVTNAGQTAAEIQVTSYQWSAGTPDTGGTTLVYKSQLLMPGEFIFMPNPRIIDYDAATSAAGGATLDNQVLHSSTYVAVDSQLLNEALDGTETGVDVDDGDWFEVGDYIRVENEIMEVTGISTNTLTVIRGVQGSTKATHVEDSAIRFPFSNIDHDFDDVTVDGSGDGSSIYVKTNSNGDYHAMNLGGYGRTATKKASGFVPGSLSFLFYTEGAYQNLGMKSQTLATTTGLAVSTEYGFDLSCDGTNTTSDTIKFTTDSSDVTWGSTSNGVLYKLNEIMTDNNLKCSVSIVNGDIQFKSLTNHSASAILLAAPSAGETTPFGVGRIPAIATVTAPVASSLPLDIVTDGATGLSSPNRTKMLYDNGDGTMSSGGAISGSGTINYLTGEITMRGCPKNAVFVVSGAYGSAHSSGLRGGGGAGWNILKNIEARSVSAKLNTTVEIRGYN